MFFAFREKKDPNRFRVVMNPMVFQGRFPKLGFASFWLNKIPWVQVVENHLLQQIQGNHSNTKKNFKKVGVYLLRFSNYFLKTTWPLCDYVSQCCTSWEIIHFGGKAINFKEPLLIVGKFAIYLVNILTGNDEWAFSRPPVRTNHILIQFQGSTCCAKMGIFKPFLVGGWTNPSEKHATVKLDDFHKFRGENSKTCLSCHHPDCDLKTYTPEN